MNAYYAERKGLITQQLKLSLEELLNSFIQVYHYFHRKGSFDLAFRGANDEDRWTHETINILPPTMAPSPEVYFMTHLQDKQVWPIAEYYEGYTEEILFSVIEMLYSHIGIYNYATNKQSTHYSLVCPTRSTTLGLYRDYARPYDVGYFAFGRRQSL